MGFGNCGMAWREGCEQGKGQPSKGNEGDAERALGAAAPIEKRW